MSVYNYRVSGVIKRESIPALRLRMRQVNLLGFTYDEFLHLLAPPEHHHILKTASEFAKISADGGNASASFHSLKHGDVTLNFGVTTSDETPLLPRSCVVLKSAPQELRAKLEAFVATEVEISLAFGKVVSLFDWLDEKCASKAQMRAIWPSIVPLLTLSHQTSDAAERVREFKPQRTLPHIPTEVRAACKETAGLIASAMLLGDEPEPFNPQVSVDLEKVWKSYEHGALGVIEPV